MAKSKKEKKGIGCLPAMIIIGAAMIGLLIVAASGHKERMQKEWAQNKAMLMPQIEKAVEEGRPQEAIDLGGRYKYLNDPQLNLVLAKADAMLTKRRSEAEAKVEAAAKAAQAKADAEKQAAEAEALAAEAAKPMWERIKGKLHRDLGHKGKWDALRNADFDADTKTVSVSFDVNTSELSAYFKMADVIQSVLAFKEVENMSLTVFSEYTDVDGNTAMHPWISLKITREAADKAKWENLRGYGDMEKFFKARGELKVRGK